MVVHRNIQLSAFSLSTTFLHGQLLSTSDLSIYFVSTRFFFFVFWRMGLGWERGSTLAFVIVLSALYPCAAFGVAPLGFRLPLASL